MKRRSRMRRALKWAGVAVCMLVLGVGIVSFAFPIYPQWLHGYETWYGGIGI